MNLLRVVFSEVFPPLFVVALCGIGLFFSHVTQKERLQRMLLVLGCGCLFVLFRMGGHKLSGRYVVILIPVATVVAVYGIYGARWPLWLKRLIVLLLVVVALGKTSRINRHNNYYATLCRQIRADAAKYKSPVIADFTGHALVVQYYSGISAVSFVSIPPGKTISEIIGNFLQDYRYRGDVLYVIIKAAAATSPLVADATTVRNGEWKLFYSEYDSNRHNRKLWAYRFLPHIVKTEAQAEISSTEAFVLYRTGFEAMELFDAQREQKGKVLLKRGISFFSNPVNLPVGWEPNPSHGYVRDCRGEVEVVSEPVLSGKRSLRMKSGNVISLVSPNVDIVACELQVGLQGQALTSSRFGIMLYVYDGKRYEKSLFSGYVTVIDKKKKHYEFVFVMDPDMLKKSVRVCLALWDGEMIFDDILLTSRKIEGTLGQ